MHKPLNDAILDQNAVLSRLNPIVMKNRDAAVRQMEILSRRDRTVRNLTVQLIEEDGMSYTTVREEFLDDVAEAEMRATYSLHTLLKEVEG